MRHLLILLISLSCSGIYGQQTTASPKDGLPGGKTSLRPLWEVSVTFNPSLNPMISLTGVRYESSESNVPIAQRPRTETINVFGVDRVFSTTSLGALEVKPTNPRGWYGLNLAVHRRLNNGFEVTAGAHLVQAKFSTPVFDGPVLAGGVVSTEGNILYSLKNVEETSAGLNVQVAYHLFPHRKIHPWFGGGTAVSYLSQSVESLGQLYTGEGDRIIPLPNGPNQQNTGVFDLRLVMSSGALYQITSRWAAGLTASTRFGRGSGLFGAQVRRSL